MTHIGTFFRVERIKWRRGWPMLMSLLAPACQFLFLFLIFWYSDDRVGQIGQGFQVWYQINFTAWNLFFMPILAALVVSLSWDLEEDSGMWKHLLLQPTPRKTHYWVKLVSHLSLLCMAQLLLLVLLLAGGLALRSQVPELAMGSVQPLLALKLTGASLLALIPVVALHTWFSVRFPGLGASLVVAGCGSWFAYHLAGTSTLIPLLPWGAAARVVRGLQGEPGATGGTFALGAIMALILMALGTFDFIRREESRN